MDVLSCMKTKANRKQKNEIIIGSITLQTDFITSRNLFNTLRVYDIDFLIPIVCHVHRHAATHRDACLNTRGYKSITISFENHNF